MVLLFLLSIEWLAVFSQSTGNMVFPGAHRHVLNKSKGQELVVKRITTLAVSAKLATKSTQEQNTHADTLGNLHRTAASNLAASRVNPYQTHDKNDPDNDTTISKMIHTQTPAPPLFPLSRGGRGCVTPSPLHSHSHFPLLRGGRGSVTPSAHTPTHPHANQTTTLQGTVADIKKEGIPGATVTVNRIGDSTWLGAVVTEVSGFFKIKNLPQHDTLQVRIRFLGFQEYDTILIIEQSHLQLDTIILKENSFELESVVVTAERPPVIYKKDTVEYNMASFSTRPYENVQDAIKKMPGLYFDNGGTLMYNGQRIAKVLVNGREYFGTDGKIALGSLPADVVEKLQLTEVRKDGTRMELDGKETEKVLNIQIKKDIKKFGTLSAAGGTDQRYEFKGNLNKFKEDQSITLLAMANNTNAIDYRNGAVQFVNAGNGIIETIGGGANYRKMINKNLDLSMSYYYNHPNSYNVSLRDRKQFIIPDSSFFTISSSDARSISNAHGINVSAQIKIDPMNSLKIEVPGLGYSRSTGISSSETNTTDEAMTPVNSLQNTYESHGNSMSIPFKVNFSRQFRNTRKYLQATLSGTYSRQTNNDWNTGSTIFYETDSVARLRQEIIHTGTGHNLAGSVQYSLPLFGKFNVSISNSFSFSSSHNDKVTWSLNANGERLGIDSLYSNIFQSQTLTNSANAALQFAVGKFAASAGATMNYNNLRQTNQSSNENITQIFNTVSPAIRLGYTLSTAGRIALNYTAYTSPPSVSQLQPVPNNTNPLYIQVGNPGLKSTLSQVYGFEYSSNTEKRNISFVLYYSPVNNKIINTVQYGSQGEQVSSYTNVDGIMSVSGIIRYDLRRRLDASNYGLKLSTGFSYGTDKNFINGVIASSSQWGISPSINTDLTINNLLDVTLIYTPSFTILRYEKNPSQDQNFIAHQAGMTVNLYLNERLMFRNNISCTINNNLPSGFSKVSALWNSYISYLFLKDKKAELGLSAYDLLRQNNNVLRVADQNYIESMESNNMQQFFMVVATYYLR
jgi:hypothetical protein